MSVAYSRTLVGPQEVFATESLRQTQLQRDEWPYWDLYAPPETDLRTPPGFIVAPNVGVTAQVLLFSVESGFYFLMTHLLIGAFQNNQVPLGNPGDYTFSIDINTPIGSNPVQGGPLADWNNIPFNLGSLTHGPWKLPRSRIFSPLDDIRAKVLNNSGGAGGGNFICALFGGYLVPTDWRRGK